MSQPFLTDVSLKDRMTDIVTTTMVGTALSMANELGLFQALMDAGTPLSADQVAQRLGLKERYVREAMGCMVCAGIVDAEKVNGKFLYKMPKGAEAVFKDVTTMFIYALPSLIGRYSRIRDCFAKNGPNGFVMDDDPVAQWGFRKMSWVRNDFDVEVVLNKVPGLRKSFEKGIDVLEFGSGSGGLISLFAEMFPKSNFVATEVSAEGVRKLKEELAIKNLPNVQVQLRNALNVDDEIAGKFDLVLLCFVCHILEDPVRGLQGCHRALRTGGHLVLVDTDSKGDLMVSREQEPHKASVVYAFSLFHCIPQTYGICAREPVGCNWGTDNIIACVEEARFKILSVQRKHNWVCNLMVCQA